MRDESSNRKREEALARRLGEALDRVSQGGPRPCPDAELIAAYREKALGPEEAALCEGHFAGCSRCRKILAVLAASDDTPLAEKEVARLGELVAAAVAPPVAAMEPAKPARSRRWDWRMRWLAPALGVAAVLAIWLTLKPAFRGLNQGSPGTLVAQAPKNEPLPPAESLTANQASSEAPAGPPATNSAPASGNMRGRSAANAAEEAAPADALAKKDLDDRRASARIASGASVPENALSDQTLRQSEMKGAVGGTVPSPPPPPLPQAQLGVAAQAPPQEPGSPAATTQSVTVTSQAPVIATAGAAQDKFSARDQQEVSRRKSESVRPLAGRGLQSLMAAKTGAEIPGPIKSPSGKMLWRVGKGGSIERSTDSGNAWTRSASPVQEDWLAGAAVSDTACWIVGRNGSIARTTDGERWEKIPAPSMSVDASGKLPDWVSVTAGGAQAATITSADQRRFTTQDGGKTWQAQ